MDIKSINFGYLKKSKAILQIEEKISDFYKGYEHRNEKENIEKEIDCFEKIAIAAYEGESLYLPIDLSEHDVKTMVDDALNLGIDMDKVPFPKGIEPEFRSVSYENNEVFLVAFTSLEEVNKGAETSTLQRLLTKSFKLL